MDETTSRRLDRAPLGEIDFLQVFAKTPTPLMMLNRDLVIVFANEAYLETTCCAMSELQARYVFEVFPETEERMAVFEAAFRKALAGTPNKVITEPFAIPLDGGGTREIVWTCTHQPIHDARGDVAFVLQNALDITEKHNSEKANQVLMRELDHRVKNSLATVQAVARMSLVDSKTMQEARDDLLARMHAMSEVQNLLVEKNWNGSHVAAVSANAMNPFGYDADAAGRITLDGPHVTVTAKQAQALSMALHELATNASKYGALSNDEGTIHIGWTYDQAGNGHFALTWRESGGPEVRKPTRKGFGTTMLTRILAQEINGDISLEYNVGGLVCTMEGWLEDRT